MRNDHLASLRVPFNRRQAFKLGAMGAVASLASVSVEAKAADDLPTPRYKLSCNTELMFPPEMPRTERLHVIADQGLTHYSFWSVGTEELKQMAKTAEQLKLSCGSIAATPVVGWKGGLTQTGSEAAWLAEIANSIEVAKVVGVQNLISFVGLKQENIPLEVQHRQIVAGLKKAGDLAAKSDVYIVLEPLNPFDSPGMSVLSAKYGFQIIEEVDHPRVKLDFDIYHLQLSEGNLINHLRLGLKRKWIQFVEVGDVPGRKEPGTGEINYANIFKVLQESGYDGLIGMEHGSSSSAQHAIQQVKAVARV